MTLLRRVFVVLIVLLRQTDDIRVGIYEKMVTLLLLFDFSNAFDTISPIRLITKTKELGLTKTVLRWIALYLLEREKQVVSKSVKSEYLEINLGVPRGSGLGPLLICLYINVN